MAMAGAWAIDQFKDSGMQTHYFKDRKQAAAFQTDDSFTLRRVNLEDAFLSLTGKKVQP